MDIVKTIGSETKYTFHSHTQFCDGRASMEDFALAAINQDFRHYGYSPHSPVPVESPCNMSFESVDTYLKEVDRLKAKYGDRISLYAGMEIDYLGKGWGPSHEYFQTLPLDYRIGSVHFIPDQKGEYIDIDGSAERFRKNMSAHFQNDIRYVVETFFEHSCEMIEAGGFDIIGHFDKIGQNACYYQSGLEDEQWYVDLVENLIDKIIRHGTIVEINTKSKLVHGRLFPSERYIPQLIEANVPIIVNSDAHQPDLINSSRQYALDLLDKIKADIHPNDAR